MADNKLVGQNYTTPDLVAKVTGKAKYAEDFRAEGMLFAKLLLQPDAARARDAHRHERGAGDAGRQGDPHRRRPAGAAAGATLGEGVSRERAERARPDRRAALPGRADSRRRGGRRAHGGRGDREDSDRFEPLPFVVDPIESLRPGSPNARTQGNVWMRAAGAAGGARGGARRSSRRGGGAAAAARRRRLRRALRRLPRRSARGAGSGRPRRQRRAQRGRGAAARRRRRRGAGAQPAAGARPRRRPRRGGTRRRRPRRPRAGAAARPQIRELKWTEEDFAAAEDGQLPMGKPTDEWVVGDVEAGFKKADLVLDETFVSPVDRPSAARNAHGDGLLAERQAATCTARRRAPCRRSASVARWVGITPDRRRPHQRVHRRRLRQQDSGRDLDGDSGAALEEGERAGDDAHHARGRALHRPRAAGHARRASRSASARTAASPRSTCSPSATTVRTTRRATARSAGQHVSLCYQPEAMRWRGVDGADQHAAARRRSARRAACRATASMEPMHRQGRQQARASIRWRSADQRAGGQGAVRPAGRATASRHYVTERVRQGSARQGRGAVQVGREEGAQRQARSARRSAASGVAVSAVHRRLDRLRRPVRHQAGRPDPVPVGHRQPRHALGDRRASRGGRDARRAVGAVRRRLGQHRRSTCRGPASRPAARRRTR